MTDFDSCELAPFSCQGEEARAHVEHPDSLRGPFALDRHRIIECTAFRRLEGKTQVFAPSHHDHFRTRLTHTLEASQIARTLAHAMRLNEDLAEAITLAHDLGHPPFGHAGEKALSAAMDSTGGFNHNLHALRVVEYLEHPFPAFRGLNLTAGVRKGLCQHATTYDVPGTQVPNRAPSVEAQVSSLADRIAYNCHDLEDAIGAELVRADELTQLSLWRNACDLSETSAEAKHLHAIRRPVLDAMLNTILDDALESSAPLLAKTSSSEDVSRADAPLVKLSDGMEESLREVERFLHDRVYHNSDVSNGDAQGQEKILFLFGVLGSHPNRLPDRFAARIKDQGIDRVVCDYIAGMTDRYCTEIFDDVVRT